MAREPQKWALLVGINEYPEWSADHQLRGAINDVNAIEGLLTGDQFGFPPKHILKLTSPANDGKLLANRESILTAFRAHLIENERIRQGDVVVIYYSGHGSWVRDKNLDEEVDVVDNLRLARDETLVPCDSGSDHARDIIDDEIAELLEALAARTTNINLFFDSCHSGTVTRVLPESEDAQDRARWLPPPPDAYVRLAQPERFADRHTRSMEAGGWLSPSGNYVVISACHSSERAHEHRFLLSGLKYHGILTYCLLKALRDVGPETTYYDIWEDVRVAVNKLCHEQNPQIEGAFERKVFGGASLPRKRYVEVTEAGDLTVTLAAGLVHGATVGSRFATYRKGTQTFENEMARVAVVKLTSVDAFTSTGAIEEGDVSRIEAGDPAVEIEHNHGTMQMPVRVVGDDPVLDLVRREVEASPLLTLAETDEQPSIATVRLRHPLNPDGSEDAGHARMLYILSGGDGRAMAEPIAPDADGGPKAVRSKLDDVAKHHNLLAIHNTDPQSKLKGKVKLRLLKRIGQGEDGQDLVEPVERTKGGDFMLRVEDRVFVEVENQSDQTLHVAIFNCQSNWEVGPVFPVRGAADDVVSARSLRRTIRFRARWPDDHPKATREDSPLPRDTLKMFATTKQIDFHSFWASRTRALGEKASLPRLIGLAAGGGPTHVTRSLEEGEEDWATDQLAFYITP